ncbi:MAG: MarR family transcriptional regulator [Burkholderiales bacterium]|nr:MarR family transcriptional regulator [Burkholderiales bacterium]
MTLQLIPALHRATHRVGLSLAALREHALSQGEAHILAHLAASGPATIGQLHAVLAHKRSTLTSILDRLVERGLVTREVSASDRRTFDIALTRSGRKVAGQTHRHLLDIEAAVAARFPASAVQTFLAVAAAIEQAAHEAAG